MDSLKSATDARVGIIISMFPELHETFILRELVALERRGMRFDVYSLQFPRDPITLDDALRLSEQRTHYSKLFTVQTCGALLKSVLTRPVQLTKAISQVVWFGRDRPMDIIKNLAVLPITLHFGQLGRANGVTHWHGHWANIPTTACWYLQQVYGESWSAAIHGEDIFSANRFLQHKLNGAKFCAVCSGYFCKHLKNEMQLDSPDKIHLNYHGLDPRVTQRAVPENRNSENAAASLSVVSIGRLVPTKGHDVLIKACAQLVQQGISITVNLIGSGPLDKELRELTASLGVEANVKFSGALGFEQVLQTLEHADVFALAPRLIPGQPPDGIPNVIAEAMALGVPVVTTRVSAIPELIIDKETGLLVEVDDVDAFAAAIASIHESPQSAQQYREAARARVAQMFNQDSNIDDLLALFDQYVGENFTTAGASE